MRKESKFSIKDLVLLGAMNAVLVILYYLVIMLLHLIPPLWGFIDPVVNLVLVPVYALMLRLIPKMFVMTIHGAIIGAIHIAIGWWPGLFAGIIGGLAADLTACFLGGYSRPRAVIAGVCVYTTVKAMLFYAPLYLFVFAPVFQEVVSTWPQESLDLFSGLFPVIFLALNLAASLTGLKLGQKLISRHFVQTGAIAQ